MNRCLTQRLAGICLILLSVTQADARGLNIYWVDVEGGAATLIVTPTGESVLLTYEGDDYAAGFDLTSWHVRILVTADFSTFEELVSFDTDVPPRCIAYWRGQLYYGTDHGQVCDCFIFRIGSGNVDFRLADLKKLFGVVAKTELPPFC